MRMADEGEIGTTGQTKGEGKMVHQKMSAVEVVKIACPEGRMRGETPNKE